MDKINVNLENCYGIKKLDFCFDFSKNRTYTIYAPNGFMKTSFAKTFMDFSKKRETKDLIFPNRVSKRIITDENSTPISPEQVFVIEPYNEGYNSEKVSTLLVNKDLKKRYDEILSTIENHKEQLIKELKALSGLKTNIEEVFSRDILHYQKVEFFKAISRLKSEVNEVGEPVYANIKYTDIFNAKVIDFLETKDFKDKLMKYIETYDDLIGNSIYFKKGVFNHTNASVIAKNLKDNGFFKAKHSVVFNLGKEKKEISTEEELETVIEEEKNSILNNPDLVQAFNDIDAKLKNKELRDFRDFLVNNKEILTALSDLNQLKSDLWVSYLKEKKDLYEKLESEFNKGRIEIEVIFEQAKKEETHWRNVIKIFNDRFDVPFKISVDNQDDVILKSEAPNFRFDFDDKIENPISIERNKLLEVLSNGEKRALYILNIIFEIEARKEGSQKTLFIIDDIADSFDYKNKYAIIEYLKENGEQNNFHQVILTHNFDFFRTVQSRIIGGETQRDTTYIAQRDNGKITLSSAGHRNITNPFDVWKKQLNNKVMFVATIPFIRNLVEYREGSSSDNYKKLTSLLHIKDDSFNITILDIKSIYSDTIKSVDLSAYSDTDKVIDVIFEASELVYNDTNEDALNLENKITISIGIRLKAEKLMWSKVADKAPIHGTQTGKLFERFKTEFLSESAERSNIELCALVNLMTPENIHINSFMYEPILDMSIRHLKKLYSELNSLI